MSEFDVIVLIGDPWEFGEAVGWKMPQARLYIETEESGHILLEEELAYDGGNYHRLNVSTRYEGKNITSVSGERVACNFEGVAGDKKLRFTGSLGPA